MRERRLRRLFTRYAKSGDLDALGAVFDATAPGLAGLARHLVGSAQGADDAVQATFLTAIERAADYDPARALEPWLTGILVRKARAARSRREPTGLGGGGLGAGVAGELDRPDERAESDPARQASDGEFSEHLGRALSGLPEPYRLVLLPFLQEGDRPRDIARRTGIAPGTIRVRIHRGLKLLRAALPAGYAATAGAAVPQLEGLGPVRASVLDAARAGSSGAVSGVATTAAASWGLPGAAALAVTAALVGLGAWGWVRSSRSDVPGLTVAAARPAEDAGAAGEEERLPADVPRAANEARTPAAAERRPSAVEGADSGAGWTLVADVRGLDVSPPGDLSLSVAVSGTPGPPIEVPIRSNGPLSVELPRASSAADPPRLELRVDHDAFASFVHQTGDVELDAADRLAVEVRLERTAWVVEGRVATSAPGAAPVVSLFARQGENAARRVADTGCAPDGSFSLLTAEDEGWIVVTAPGHAPSGVRLAPLASDIELGLVELERGASLQGFAYAGEPVEPRPGMVTVTTVHPLARSAPQTSVGGVQLLLLEDGVVTAGASAHVDASGEFHVAGLTPGPYHAIFVPRTRASGFFDPADHGTRVEAPAADLELVSPTRVYALRVVAGGEPLPDAMVKFHLPTGSVAGPTNAEGVYDFFTALSDEPLRISVSKPGFEARELTASPVELARQVTVELERTAPGSTLVLDFATERGPVGQLGFRLSLVDSPWYLYRGTSGAHADLGEVPAGRYRLDVWPMEDEGLAPTERGHWLRTQVELACRPSVDERVAVALTPAGRVLFHVSGRSGSDVGDWSLHGADGGLALRLVSWDATGDVSGVAAHTLVSANEIGEIELTDSGREYWLDRPLPPGEYRLDVTRGEAREEHAFRIEAGQITDVFLDF